MTEVNEKWKGKEEGIEKKSENAKRSKEERHEKREEEGKRKPR